MNARRAVLALALLFGLVALLAAACVETGLQRHDVLERRTQPAGVTYDDDRTHHVGVVRVRSRLLGRTKSHMLYAGGDPALSYGHFVELRITGEDRPVLTGVRWEKAGLWARFRSGHELFVPAEKFTGGR